MIVTYRCKCGNVFNGHWHQAFKQATKGSKCHSKPRKPLSHPFIAMMCPKCGNIDIHNRNIDCDEEEEI